MARKSIKSESEHIEAEQSIDTRNATIDSPVISPVAVATVVPMTVAGQRYISPPGRHSKQTHRIAGARGEALGLTTVRELYDHDRNAVLAKLQKTSDGVAAQLRNEQNRRSGTTTDKT